MHDQFRHAAANAWRMLHAVAAEPGRMEHPGYAGVGPDDAVMIEQIHVVIPSPTAGQSQRFERRHAGGQH